MLMGEEGVVVLVIQASLMRMMMILIGMLLGINYELSRLV